MAKLGYFDVVSLAAYIIALISLAFPQVLVFFGSAPIFERAGVILVMVVLPGLPVTVGRRREIKSRLCGVLPVSEGERKVLGIIYKNPSIKENEIANIIGIKETDVHVFIDRLRRRRLIDN